MSERWGLVPDWVPGQPLKIQLKDLHLKPEGYRLTDQEKHGLDYPAYLYDLESHRTVETWRLVRNRKLPAFTHISHSWGGLKPLSWVNIQGVSWPMEMPSSLSVDKMIESLHRMVKGKYLWIDWLCIPQNDPRLMNQEIAKQGSIFKLCEKVSVIWWHEARAQVVGEAMERLQNRFKELDNSSRMTQDAAADRLGEVVEWFLQFSWCTSLWTLQETASMSECTIYSGYGYEINFYETILKQKVSLTKHLMLRWLNTAFLALRKYLLRVWNEYKGSVNNHMSYTRANDILTRLCILGLASNEDWTPQVLLCGSEGRRTMRPEDSVYAIMGFFGISIPIAYNINLVSLKTRFRYELLRKLGSALFMFEQIQEPRTPGGSLWPKKGATPTIKLSNVEYDEWPGPLQVRPSGEVITDYACLPLNRTEEIVSFYGYTVGYWGLDKYNRKGPSCNAARYEQKKIYWSPFDTENKPGLGEMIERLKRRDISNQTFVLLRKPDFQIISTGKWVSVALIVLHMGTNTFLRIGHILLERDYRRNVKVDVFLEAKTKQVVIC
jgi:hypothetical protein